VIKHRICPAFRIEATQRAALSKIFEEDTTGKASQLLNFRQILPQVADDRIRSFRE